MSAHFWLSADAVPISLEEIAAMTDEQARQFLAKLRWGDTGMQICPDCGVVDKHYAVHTRGQWRCKHCFCTFSVTTKTPFADHKIGYRKLLLAIFAFIINHKGLAALTLTRMIGVQYRTAFTLLHKIREAVMLTVNQAKLSGQVEMDGGHFSGKKRKGRKLFHSPFWLARSRLVLPERGASKKWAQITGNHAISWKERSVWVRPLALIRLLSSNGRRTS